MPKAPSPDESPQTRPASRPKPAPQKALEEQRRRELPSNDWPGKGAA